MAWFRGKQAKGDTILRVRIDDVDIASISQDELPAEKQPSVQIDGPTPALIFTDRNAKEHVFDLTDTRQSCSWAHFSIRMHPNFAVQADCLLSHSRDIPQLEFSRGKTPGLRLQPFFVSESDVNPGELIGRGLFQRCLHFSGSITPGNVSLLCLCDVCRRSFHLQSFHAGFSHLAYFYCDSGIHTLVADQSLDDVPPVLGSVDLDSLARFEATLPPCRKCGGAFRYYNPLRCPHCAATYIDFQRFPKERENEYYGNHLFRDEVQSWAATKS